MWRGIPRYCRPEALELMNDHVATLDETESLLACAVALALHDHPETLLSTVDETLTGYVDTIRSRAHDNPRSIFTYAHQHLFDELQFRGNTEDYLDPQNSYLPHVLESRKGLPITLVLIYKVVLERLGLETHGIGAPGHFLARVSVDGHEQLVDPFTGGTPISDQEAFQRIETATGKRVTDHYLLRPVTHHMWIFRMLNNLEIAFHQAERAEDQRAMQELKSALYG